MGYTCLLSYVILKTGVTDTRSGAGRKLSFDGNQIPAESRFLAESPGGQKLSFDGNQIPAESLGRQKPGFWTVRTAAIGETGQTGKNVGDDHDKTGDRVQRHRRD